ncbi:CGNR zinc finger domain-containing protein [Nonomuraea typhae]|uniref:CGNR zinc finger domain-containing protein n=1 Tax=Nonomuraea typhae TaxID=2603600 RepID=A0ABW7YP73_9ACTN
MSESAAPGALEQVRTFLNTWWVPNDTRAPEDRLPALLADPAAWQADLPAFAFPGREDAPGMAELRAALRAALGEARPVALGPWLARHPLRAELSADPDRPPLALVPEDGTAGGTILAAVAEAVRAGQWARLKACPDCSWVFYDHSRNGSRRWCVMNPGGSESRGCGSIAKVKAYRERRRITS